MAAVLIEGQVLRVAIDLDAEILSGREVLETAGGDVNRGLILVPKGLVKVEHVLFSLAVTGNKPFVIHVLAVVVFHELDPVLGIHVTFLTVGHREIEQDPDRREVQPRHGLYLADMRLMETVAIFFIMLGILILVTDGLDWIPDMAVRVDADSIFRDIDRDVRPQSTNLLQSCGEP